MERFVSKHEPDQSHGLVVLELDLAPATPDIVPGIGSCAHGVTQVFAIMDGVRQVAVGEAVKLPGLEIVGALDDQVDGLAVLTFALLVDVPMVDRLILMRHWW